MSTGARPDALVVRAARLDDLPAIAAIDAVGRPQARPLTLFAAALERLLVIEADTLLGFAELQVLFEDAELIDVAVAPAARRQGLGRRLLDAVVVRAAAAGATRLLLEVRRDNTPARMLYESAGFAVCGERHRYYADGHDAVLYERSLSGGSSSGD